MNTQQTAVNQLITGANSQAAIYAMPDRLLALIVKAIIKEEKDVELALYVSGAIVSGFPISEHRYFDSLKHMSSFSLSHTRLADILEEVARSYATDNGLLENSTGDNEGESKVLSVYIHLSNASIWAPGIERSTDVGLWRGRMSHVSAWSVGKPRAS